MNSYATESFTGAHYANSAWRWETNNNVPPADILDAWVELGYIKAEDAEASKAISKSETLAFLSRYAVMQQPEASSEERAEMFAAFGPGARVVDVITGRVTQL